MLLHVAVHRAQLDLPAEVDVHGALLHRRVDELVRWIPQLQPKKDKPQVTRIMDIPIDESEFPMLEFSPLDH